VRRTLQLRTAELAAIHRTEADADELAQAADVMAAADADLEQITSHDIRFHQTIARASGNALAHQIVRSFGPLMTVAIPTVWRTRVTPAEREDILNRHHLR